jgi:hypothetical protein
MFDGAPTTETHEHFDPDGNLTGRTVVTVDSPWDETARAWALGLTMREAVECRRCSGDLSETTDYGWQWVPSPPTVCLRCVALQAAESSYAKHPHRGAMSYRVTKRQRPQRKPKSRKRR